MKNCIILTLVNNFLNKDAGARKAFPEILGRAAFLLFKNAVEVRNIVKTTMVGNFGNRLGGIY